MRVHARRTLALAALCVALIGAVLPAHRARATLSNPRFVFTAVADTHVDAAAPTTSYATSTGGWVDKSPLKQTFFRWAINGLGDRQVTDVKLRLYQRDNSVSGGQVRTLPSNSWSESVTWESRPALGPVLAAYGAVAKDRWYELSLGPVVTGDGNFSLGMDSLRSDGAKWGTRESTSAKPQLIVEVAPGGEIDGLSTVVERYYGSGDPTYFSNNHRVARTSGGRLLAVHGRHASGVQLSWRDPGDGWRTTSMGGSADGMILGGTGTGDWPASIAIARDGTGAEHAYVVWAGTSFSTVRPVQMARITYLDANSGPSIGPVVTVDAPPRGAIKPDVAVERSTTGEDRVVVSYTRAVDSAKWEIRTAWVTDVSAITPIVTNVSTLLTSTSSSNRIGTLVAGATGTKLVARSNSSKLQIFAHDSDASLSTWQTGAMGMGLGSGAHPSAVELSSGEVLAVVESDSATGAVSVQRFSALGDSVSPSQSFAGSYRHPSIATNGTMAWVVMVRKSDGYVVSREYEPALGWTTSDRVEIGSEGGGNYAWPNAIHTDDDRLRFVVRGPKGSTYRASGLAFQRPTS